jgi:hypothetical protein
MTEEEWNGCNDPEQMLEFLRGKASDRKLRLFAVACCRRIWNLLPDEACRQAVEVAERFADGMCGEQELQAATDAAYHSAEENENAIAGQSFAAQAGIYFARRAAAYAAIPSAHEAGVCAARRLHTAAVGAAGDPNTHRTARQAASADVCQYRITLLRDIFGPPCFRPVDSDSSWRTEIVTNLAQAIYSDKAFDRLPILADALEEAGCTNAELLSHCRGRGPHVRGCWALDLVLGKE